MKVMDELREFFLTLPEGWREWTDLVDSFAFRRNNDLIFGVSVDVIVRPDNDRQTNPGGTYVTISWSSTGRTLAEAAAAVALYNEAVQIGFQIQAFLEGYYRKTTPYVG
jgi:hypothetical protein